MVSTDVLRDHPCFQRAADDAVRTLADNSVDLTFQAGDTLFREDQPAHHMYIVIRGEVDIQYVLNTGERRTVDTRVAGDLLLWSAVVKPFRTTANGVARTETTVVAIDAPTLRRMAEDDPDLDRRLMREIANVVSQRLQVARVQLAAAG